MITKRVDKKLAEIGVDVSAIVMGDFDYIGRFTAERQRSKDDPNYRKYGAFYRSNYERGILIYNLIRQYDVKSVLEIGFGRGYSTFCAAMAFNHAGTNGTVTSIDPQINAEHFNMLKHVIPEDYFKHVKIIKGNSQAVLPSLKEKYDLIYIDGDHSYHGTKTDWEYCSRLFTKMVLFDDYHLPTKDDAGIACRQAIDEIDESKFDCAEKELLICDRRMFFDDRRLSDAEIDYGQVLLTKKDLNHVSSEW